MFNVVTGNGELGSMIASHPQVHKVAFTGSTEVGKHLRQLTAGTGKKLSLGMFDLFYCTYYFSILDL